MSQKVSLKGTMFLTLEEFLAYFPKKDISKADFVKEFTVMYTIPQTLTDLFDQVSTGRRKPIIKSEEDKRYINRDQIVDYFYQILITERYKYLTCFYEAYFEFKDPRKLKWEYVDLLSEKEQFDDPIVSLQKNDASRRIIRNLFHRELLDLTKITNTVKSSVSFWESLVNLYNKLQLEDRFFAPSSIDLFLRDKKTKREERTGIREINYNNLFYLFQAYQPKASIFNPYSIKWILDELLPAPTSSGGGRIFTPVLSWGSYIVSFMHSTEYTEYIGVDVMPSVCKKCEFLGEWYRGLGPNFSKRTTKIYCTPSEKLLHDKKFMAQYEGYFDTILLCPPYYDMEIYHEGEQSIDTYKTYKQWLDGYWRRTVELCKHVCKLGGTFAVIANDYYTLDKKHFPITKDLDEITTKYFQYHEKYYLQNRTSPLRVNAKDRTERLFIYEKM